MTDLPATAIPPRAYTAFGEAIQAYEPEAMALIVRSPAALLQILLEAGRRAAVAAAPHITAAERQRLAGDGTQEALGQLVREVWVEWAREQPEPRSSWLLGWDYLDDGQREVDMRIGATVAAVARAAERARLREHVATLTDWLEHLPQRHVPLRAAEALLRLQNLTAPGDTP